MGIVDLQEGKLLIGCKWVYTLKYNLNGIVQLYKARLVAIGFTQTYGMEYGLLCDIIYVAKLNSVWVIFSVAVNLD